MKLVRFWRHLVADMTVRRTFPKAVLTSIGRAITAQERRHTGELRFVIEGGLPTDNLFHGQLARARAVEMFARLRVWDTEHNSGVLLYVLLGDRAVEIVADRGIQKKVGQAEWESICRVMELHFARREFESGALAGLERIAELLAAHFPASGERPNELPDRPVIL